MELGFVALSVMVLVALLAKVTSGSLVLGLGAGIVVARLASVHTLTLEAILVGLIVEAFGRRGYRLLMVQILSLLSLPALALS